MQAASSFRGGGLLRLELGEDLLGLLGGLGRPLALGLHLLEPVQCLHRDNRATTGEAVAAEERAEAAASDDHALSDDHFIPDYSLIGA